MKKLKIYLLNSITSNIYIPIILHYAEERNVHVVFRPDSGDLIDQTIQINNKYNVWSNWSIIIGEGMSLSKIEEFDKKLLEAKFPLDKMSYGIGAGFYKHIDRDWLGHAMKTAYSNGKPRMKLSTPFKTSIPNTVNLVYDDYGKLMVDYTRDGENHDSLYYDVWHYDTKTDKPYFNRQDWSEIRDLATLNLGKKLQEDIILSPLVHQAIGEFRSKYGTT